MNEFRILMIDDSELILARASEALIEAGFSVFTTTQTYAADRFLKDVDLVIIDFHMPGIGGGDLVKQLRAACATTNPGCRFYLNTVDKTVARDFKNHGFDGAFARKGDAAALARDVTAIARMRIVNTIGRRASLEQKS